MLSTSQYIQSEISFSLFNNRVFKDIFDFRREDKIQKRVMRLAHLLVKKLNLTFKEALTFAWGYTKKRVADQKATFNYIVANQNKVTFVK